MIIRKNPNLKYAILPKSKSLFLGYKCANDKNWRYFMMYNKYIDMFKKYFTEIVFCVYSGRNV